MEKNQPNVQNPKRNKTGKKKKEMENSNRNKARIHFSKGDKLSKFAMFEKYYKSMSGKFFRLDKRKRRKRIVLIVSFFFSLLE